MGRRHVHHRPQQRQRQNPLGAVVSAKDRVASYPVLTATLLAPLVAYLGGKLGLDLDDAEAAWLAGAVLAAGSTIATNLVRTRRTLPDPEATRSNSAVEVRPTTFVHRPGVPDPLPTRPDPGRPERLPRE